MHARHKLLSTVLLLAGLILAAYIAEQVPGQWDLTEENLYTLSEGSREIVADLEEPVQLTLYFSRSLEALPISVKNYATRVEDLLRQYSRAGAASLQLEVVDPRPDTEQEEAALRAGLTPRAFADGSDVFFGLEAVQADNTASIPFFTFNREPFLEYDISQLIHQVQLLDKPVVGILSSLPIEGSASPQMPGMPPQQPEDRWLFLQELERTYTLRMLDLETELPDNLDLLVLLHPQDLPEARLFEIDQFLLSGNPVLAVLDPVSWYQRSREGQQQMMMGMPGGNHSSDLGPILRANGIRFSTTLVVGDPNLATPISVQQGAPPVRYPLWLSLTDPESTNPATASLSSLLFPEAGFLELDADSGLTLTPLLETTESAGTIESQMTRFTGPDRIGNALSEEREKRVLAALIEGPFQTAFPDGPPEDGETEEAEAEAGGNNESPEADEAHLTESAGGRSLLLVVTDSDFLSNSFSVRVVNLLGMQSATPLNDNLSFFFNAVDTLTGSPELVSLRGKGQVNRPFTVVEEMERAAQEEYQEQLIQLEERLRSVQQELRQLQQQQADGQMLIASPETRETIEQYQIEEAEVRSDLREIRKKLREDVESLNLRLAMINLLLVPAVVILSGILYFWKFHRS